jgi:DNA-binding response OmpR family regulator
MLLPLIAPKLEGGSMFMAQQCRILVIDDDPHLCRTLTLMLEHAGYAVTGALGDQEALGHYNFADYDLILLDITTLAPSGVEVLRWLRQCCARLPILVLIGEDLSNLDAELRQQGAKAILYKPFNAESLLVKVTELLRPNDQPDSPCVSPAPPPSINA